MKRRIIFFDIGNTLATAMELTPRRLWATRLGLSEKETRRAGRLIMTENATTPSALAEALSRILPDRDPEDLLEAARALWLEQSGSVREIPGAITSIKALHGMGYRLGLLSNTWSPLFEGFRRVFFDVAGLLDTMVLSFQEGCKKPSREIFHLALRKAALPASDCWMVGDSYELDMEPAMESGMNTLWVLSSPDRERSVIAGLLRGEIRKPGWTVESVREIPGFFARKDM